MKGKWDELGQRNAAGFVDEFLVMQNDVVPRDAEELEGPLHLPLRVEHQLLIVDRQALFGAEELALPVHRLHGRVPLLQALAEVRQVEAGDRHLKIGERTSQIKAKHNRQTSRTTM